MPIDDSNRDTIRRLALQVLAAKTDEEFNAALTQLLDTAPREEVFNPPQPPGPMLLPFYPYHPPGGMVPDLGDAPNETYATISARNAARSQQLAETAAKQYPQPKGGAP